MQGIPVVLSAASGTGKTTLAKMLLDADPRLVLSVSCTTRPPRGSEEDGVDYHFVDVGTFEAMIARAAFIEHALVHGNRYGSSKEFTSAQLDAGRDVLFDIDVQGGAQLKALFPQALLVFLVPPSMDELERRLRRRGTDTDDVIKRRLDAARQEISAGLAGYDFVIVNERIEQALGDLAATVRSSRLQRLDRSDFARSLGATAVKKTDREIT